MNRHIVFVLAFFVLFIAIISVISLYVVNYKPVKISPKTIVVPDDYSTIQAAIDNATDGDTILVKEGTYHENPVINKPLSLIGENNVSTIIIGESGRGGGQVISILAKNTRVLNFTIESNPSSIYPIAADGIRLQADNAQITGNNIVNCYSAIFGDGNGSSSIISTNNITANGFTAIRLFGAISNITISGNNLVSNPDSTISLDGYSNTISGNKIENSRWGIVLGSGSNNNIFGNNITECSIYAISFYLSSNNTIHENYITNNTVGIYFRDEYNGENNNKFYHNNFINNTQDVYIGSPNYAEVWDNGKEGNYWSDYNGIDANNDSIGDTPYVIDANNQDRYPLIEPYSIS
jgi:nitrous oxidase accessory protein